MVGHPAESLALSSHEAFWLRPDWGPGSGNLRDPGVTPFWCRDPLPSSRSPQTGVRGPRGASGPSENTMLLHEARYVLERLKARHAAEQCVHRWEETEIRQLGRPKLRLAVCTHCGAQTALSRQLYVDPTGVLCQYGPPGCVYCESPTQCLQPAHCPRYAAIPGR